MRKDSFDKGKNPAMFNWSVMKWKTDHRRTELLLNNNLNIDNKIFAEKAKNKVCLLGLH